jgi:hypothetical protein
LSPEQVSFDGEILRAILQAFTRYSANNRQIPVSDGSLFTGMPATGKTHAIGGADNIRAVLVSGLLAPELPLRGELGK